MRRLYRFPLGLRTNPSDRPHRCRRSVSVGADADLVVLDPEIIRDPSTYEKPDVASVGIDHVMVAGAFVVKDGAVVAGATPGRAVRAPLGGRGQ